MMIRLKLFLLAALLALFAAGELFAQSGSIERISAAQLASGCAANAPRVAWVLDSSSTSTCDPTSTGSATALCACVADVWTALGSGGGGGSGDIEAVWGCTSGNCSTLTAASGDSLDAGSADASSPTTRSTSLPGSCSEGQFHMDTDSGGSEVYVCTAANTWTKLTTASDIVGVALDLDDDASNESTGLTEIASIHDTFDVLSEPSADKLLFDIDRADQRYVHGPAASPSGMDCEFDGSICSWTAVFGSSGTVAPNSPSNTSVYDTGTRPGRLLMQVGDTNTESVMLRYNYVPADGEGLYLSFTTSNVEHNNAFDCGLSITQNNASWRDGIYQNFYFDQQANALPRLLLYDTGSEIVQTGPMDVLTAVLAITRVAGDNSNAYRFWYTQSNGESWTHMDTSQMSAAPSWSWIVCNTGTSWSTSSVPIASFDWVRLGSDNPYAPGW